MPDYSQNTPNDPEQEDKEPVSALLQRYADSVNIATDLSQEELDKIGQKVLLGYKEDEKSMEEWINDAKKIEEIASLKSIKKNTPLPNSSNVKLPLINKACYEFSSATYPEIIKDDKLVKARVFGKDPKKEKAAQGERVVAFMNYQLLFESTEWELEEDRLLHLVSLFGFICKKVFYDPIRKRNRSVICNYKELFIHSDVINLEDAPRVTEILHLRMNDFIEAKNTEVNGVQVFLSKPVDELQQLHNADYLDKPIDVIQQQVKLDLDHDGYSEPYIVTVTKDLGKVLRIVARYDEDSICVENNKVCYIDPIEIYVDHHFLVSPTGKFQSVGFGFLLLHMTESCNSILNQLIDAGQLANAKIGYKDAGAKIIPSGNSLHDQSEFKDVKVATGRSLQESFFQIKYGEPSSVLHQLLGLLMQVVRDFSASAEINNGTQSSENAKTGATLALQQAGKKLVGSINKRLYRSLDKELKLWFNLNSKYLDPDIYKEVLDDTLAVRQTDFNRKVIRIMPVADPTLASEQQRMAKAQFIFSMYGKPGIDNIKATKEILDASQIPGIESIMADPNAPAAPDPQMVKIHAEMEGNAHKLEQAEKELQLKAILAEGTLGVNEAQANLYRAQAASLPQTSEMKDNELQFKAISKNLETQFGLLGMAQDQASQSADQVHQQQMQAAQQAHEQDLQSQQNEAPQNGTPQPAADQSEGS